jgi:hypothetical protein
VRLQAQMGSAGMQARLQEFTASTIPAQVDLHTLQGAFQKIGGVMRVDGLRPGDGTYRAHGRRCPCQMRSNQPTSRCR